MWDAWAREAPALSVDLPIELRGLWRWEGGARPTLDPAYRGVTFRIMAAHPGGGISGLQNGWAIAGDYLSAASFLGIAGLISQYGYDGFMYSVGWLVAYVTVLLLAVTVALALLIVAAALLTVSVGTW